MIDLLNLEENISDEMLAAYLDGNSTFEETVVINDALGSDDLLAEAVDIFQDSAPLVLSDWNGDTGCFDNLEMASCHDVEQVLFNLDETNDFLDVGREMNAPFDNGIMPSVVTGFDEPQTAETDFDLSNAHDEEWHSLDHGVDQDSTLESQDDWQGIDNTSDA